MDAFLQEWVALLLRWLHVIAGIAWIGSSFYFTHLDASLRPARKWLVALGIGIGALALGWLVHDRLCKSPLARDDGCWRRWASASWCWLPGRCSRYSPAAAPCCIPAR
jgi:uncharacterized membrane protein